jgi:hypothetical protein
MGSLDSYGRISPIAIKGNESGQNANDGEGTDPTERHFVEMAPVEAGGLHDRASLLVGQSSRGFPSHQ